MGNDIEVLETDNKETPIQEFKTAEITELGRVSNIDDNFENRPAKKKSALRILGIILLILAIILIVVETIIGIIDVGQIKDNKEPMWYLNSDVERTVGSNTTSYDLGLYVIDKIETKNEIKIILKPFFLK